MRILLNFMMLLKTTFVASLLFSNAAVGIWPIPASYEHGGEVVWLDKYTKWSFEAPKGLDKLIQDRVHQALSRAQKTITTNQLVPWKLRPHGVDFDPPIEGRHHAIIRKIIVQQLKEDEVRAPEYDKVDESYELYIPSAKGYNSTDSPTLSKLMAQHDKPMTIYIVAPYSSGILHGLTTLQQLFYAHSDYGKHGIYSPYAPAVIKDKPKFVHRGVNLDVARQWYPKTTVFRLLDGMAWNKFNRLHFHVTDSQSWPLEVPALPELAVKGAYWKNLYYTTRDIQEIYKYAEDRGIQVIMEIDMPGHTSAIGHAYPDLITGQNVQPMWTEVAAQPPSGHLKLNDSDVEKFLTKLFNDVVPRLAPYSKYFHTGGDEVNRNIYLLDENVRSNDSAVIKPYLERFLTHAHNLVRKNGATPVVWEEMVVEWGIDLPKDTVVQTWLGDQSTKVVTEKEYRVIAGNYLYWYLDCGNGQWLDFHKEMGYLYNDWCAPKKNWRLMYTYDPLAGLTPEEAKLVLGGEVHIWSEQIDSESLDSTVWPRAGAAAEVLWSGRQDAEGKNRTFPDASPRLAEIRERLVLNGIGASPIMQLWCHQHEGDCEIPSL
ncbi:glycoside hydrolase superfamily [Kalaharituber pfeilii]|nr:glycoside hydrolase superfamily [Kalaharituber pfeilii]